MNSIPISGRLLQLRCATCNKVQEPSSRLAIECFSQSHWYHPGYTLVVKIGEPAELRDHVIDIECSSN